MTSVTYENKRQVSFILPLDQRDIIVSGNHLMMIAHNIYSCAGWGLLVDFKLFSCLLLQPF
jgi:hypothetical protein